MVESHFRQLTDSEQRVLRAKSRGLRNRPGRRRWSVVAIGALVFGVLWGLTLAASDAPWHIVTGFWLVAGIGIMLWVQRDVNKDVKAFDEIRDGINSAIRANKAQVVDVKAKAFVAFEEIEDEGACYAFEIPEDKLLFLSGQQYYESAKFPSLDFSFVQALDERGRVVDEWVQKRGPKAVPLRVIPSETKRQMEVPDDLKSIEGKLTDLEELIGAPTENAA